MLKGLSLYYVLFMHVGAFVQKYPTGPQCFHSCNYLLGV